MLEPGDAERVLPGDRPSARRELQAAQLAGEEKLPDAARGAADQLSRLLHVDDFSGLHAGILTDAKKRSTSLALFCRLR
jgi:hypothetical protein